MVSLIANRRVGDGVYDSRAAAYVAGIEPPRSHRRPVRVRTGTVVLAVASFAFGGIVATVGMLLWILILDPISVPNPGPAWRCHIEWGVPTEKICTPIREEDPDFDCATMGNKVCGPRETEWS